MKNEFPDEFIFLSSSAVGNVKEADSPDVENFFETLNPLRSSSIHLEDNDLHSFRWQSL